MNGDTTSASEQAGVPASTSGNKESDPPTDSTKLNWTVIVPVALISAVVLLVGLPIGAVLIVSSSGCCLANGPENIVTFWASMTAGFLALFGMVVTAVFIITAFRVDATARAKAQLAARDEVWKYIEQYKAKLAKDLEDLETLVKKVQSCGEGAKKDIAKVQEEVNDQKDQAIRAITVAQTETTNAADGAKKAIGEARDQIVNAAREAQGVISGASDQTMAVAHEAQEAMSSARQQVERQRDEAIPVIDSARQEAEAAARVVQERARTTGDPTDTEGGQE